MGVEPVRSASWSIDAALLTQTASPGPRRDRAPRPAGDTARQHEMLGEGATCDLALGSSVSWSGSLVGVGLTRGHIRSRPSQRRRSPRPLACWWEPSPRRQSGHRQPPPATNRNAPPAVSYVALRPPCIFDRTAQDSNTRASLDNVSCARNHTGSLRAEAARRGDEPAHRVIYTALPPTAR